MRTKKYNGGANVGRLAIANALNFLDESTFGKDPYKEKSTQEIASLVNALNAEEYNIYLKYSSLYDWLVKIYGVATTNYQQIYLNINVLNYVAERLTLAENLSLYINSAPFVVNEKQYADYMAAAEKGIAPEIYFPFYNENGILQVRKNGRLFPNGIAADSEPAPIIPEFMLKTVLNFSLQTLSDKRQENIKKQENALKARKFLLKSYCYLTAYNYIIESLAKCYKIPELEKVLLPIDGAIKNIQNLNSSFADLKKAILQDNYSTPDVFKVKLEVFDKYFSPFSLEKYNPTKLQKDNVKTVLKDIDNFDGSAQLIFAEFCYRFTKEI